MLRLLAKMLSRSFRLQQRGMIPLRLFVPLRQSSRPDDFALKVKGIDATDEAWVEFEKMSQDQKEETGSDPAEPPEQEDEDLKLDRF